MCQLGKKVGAKVIAIAGSPEKCDWLEKELGVDKALNYKSPTFRKDFVKAVGYLDVFFDNVGGEILNLALTRLKIGARVVLCGESDSRHPTRHWKVSHALQEPSRITVSCRMLDWF